MARKISVAIPTVGRETLHATLRSLVRQTVPPDEVLVVNQGDPKLADELTYDLPLRVLHQDERGLSRARNRILREFNGDWVLWTDDDQEVSAEWVEQLHRLADHFGDANFFGGAVLPPLDYDAENMHMDQLFVLGEVPINRETHLRPAVQHPWLQHDIWGGNYALSRKLVESVGNYDECLGRGSKVFEKGEDTDFNLRMMAKGFTGVLSARLIIYHTYGARPKSPALNRETVDVSAVISWKAHKEGTPEWTSMLERFSPFGRKKAKLAALTGGALFGEHLELKRQFDETYARLDREFDYRDGVLVKKQ